MIKSLFKDINCWDDFVNKQTSLNNTEKGAAFELLTKLYFKTNPLYHDYDDVWLLKEVPQKELDNLKISRQDLGIDLIAKKGKEYHAIQCKYHGDKNKNITFKEVATFLQMVESNKKIEMGYICSSANGTSRNYQKIQKKNIQEILSDSWQLLNKENFNNFRKVLNKKAVTYKPFKPRKHQKKAIKQAKNHFIKENNSRGKLIFPCGAGKSLTGFWLAEALESKATLIAVPSLSLVKQTLEVYLREIVANKIKVEWLCICSDEGIGKSDDVAVMTNNIGVACKTDPKYIRDWLKANKDVHKIIFTTYQSGHLIADISKKLKMSFDVGIFDEAHKTVGSSLKQFSYLLFEKNIKIDRRIFMTATERFYSGSKEDIISMDDEDVYGATFTQMSFKEAIDLNLLTDYKVITIDIKKSEIADFIKDNNLVQLNDKWKKDTEARSLASMLAMRKAMKKFKIKNVVSFHSSIEKARRNKELQEYITNTYNYKPIDTYTVSGKIPTSKRNDIVQEFAKSNRALITNARCLTEGIDVPNIDCIVFADPRKSRVDIVQALGRALRKKEDKEWGYVILPVVYDGDTNEIDNDNFKEIINIVRGLAANDERIVEYFKDKAQKGKGSGEMVKGSDVFSLDSSMLEEKDLANQLQIKLWEKLSKFQWMPYEEAREYVRSLGLKSQREWHKYRKSGKRPDKIPSDAQSAYKKSGDWISLSDWLGSNNTSTRFRSFIDFNDARDFARSLKFKTWGEWIRFTKSTDFPEDIPVHPHRSEFYKENWISEDDWLGTKLFRKGDEYRDFKKARKFVRTLEIKSTNEWVKYCQSGQKPLDIPTNVRATYKDEGFTTMGDWLGTGRVADQHKVFLSYSDAKKFIHALGLKNQAAWNEYRKSGKKPDNIPSHPAGAKAYEGDWKGWGDWLGTGRVGNKDKKTKYKSFLEAREFARNTGINSQLEWNQYWKVNKIPEFIPLHPRNAYKDKGWNGFGDWLGTGGKQGKRTTLKEDIYYSFELARKFVHTLNIKSNRKWREYCNSGKRPEYIPTNPQRKYSDKWKGWKDFLGTDKAEDIFINIPSNPHQVYKGKGWKGFGDFLGTGTIAPQHMQFMKYDNAKKMVSKLNIKSLKEWNEYWRKNKRPIDLPYSPQSTYKKKGWVSWGEFLGTGRVSDNLKKYRSFKQARIFARKLNLKSQTEWFEYCKSGNKPQDIPRRVNSSNHYKNEWKSWEDFLGKEKSFSKENSWSFKKARKYVHNLKLKTQKEWIEYCKSAKKPVQIPVGVTRFYKNEWINYGDWLGTNRVSNRDIKYLNYEDTKNLILKMNFKNRDEFSKFASNYNKKNEEKINLNPQRKYKSEWENWGVFLGTGRKRGGDFLSFNEAKKIVQKLGLKDYKDWKIYLASKERNLNIPSDPRRKYSNDWISWDNFLGK